MTSKTIRENKPCSSGKIVITGASEHNLKQLNLKLPRDALVVFSGVSGSGKSSLAFDTLFKEGQRRFLESLSPYARQFLGGMSKPRVDRVEGLSAAISIDQKTVNRNPRSTVGTMTELYDHYRLWMARLGKPHCPKCGEMVSSLGAEQIVERLLAIHGRGKAVEKRSIPLTLLLAPIVRERKGEYRKELKQWKEQGYMRVRVDGVVRRLDEDFNLERYEKHSLELVLDRLPLEAGMRSRWVEGVERCLELSGGLVAVLLEKASKEKTNGKHGSKMELFSSQMACSQCKTAIPELEPRLFSFNDAQGACESCGGLGERREYHQERLVDGSKSLQDGALRCVNEKGRLVFTGLGHGDICRVAAHLGLNVKRHWAALDEQLRQQFLQGDGGAWLRPRQIFSPKNLVQEACNGGRWPGVVGILRVLERFQIGRMLERYQSVEVCSACQGQRLNAAALAVRFRGLNMASLTAMTLREARDFFASLQLEGEEAEIGKDILREVRSRLDFLSQVGVGYLGLDRRANTLSGGEAQRLRLASQVGSRLQGVLYVLDEPSIGLHASDQQLLLESLKQLRDLGNTVCVVEHDAATMAAADHLVDLGPGAGRKGGEILAQGSLQQVMRSPLSVSASYLRGELAIPKPAQRRSMDERQLVIRQAHCHNLKHIDVKLPLGMLCAVSGVSGSGKSTLVHQVLKPSIKAHLNNRSLPPFAKIEGLHYIDKVIEINQSPIGRTPRSNAATYTKLLDVIRDLFSRTQLARMRGYRAGRFSFNLKGGRCEICQGAGVRVIEMQFLSDVQVVCEFCQGRRFNEETLQVRYKQRHIQDVLNMTVDEAHQFFASTPTALRILDSLAEVGLGYLCLGQPSTTLSGGEAQRVKLASELCKRPGQHTLYLLDEPTTGLHAKDVVRLLACLHRLVDAGHSVMVIEHNLDVLKSADWILDLGPGGGDAGGQLLASGTPETVANIKQSLTGQLLAEVLHSDKPLGSWRPLKNSAMQNLKVSSRDILIRGAEHNNLKHIDVRIPKNQLTVLTGVSGCGKTSLALDTLFAEGQARYVESLSTYARRFLGRMDKPRVRSIEGLSPAIAIDQKHSARTPRSTVATATEIYDYLRLLYARLGQAHCPQCQQPLKGFPPSQLSRHLCQKFKGERLLISAPLAHPAVPTLVSKSVLQRRLEALQAEGFTRLWLHLPNQPSQLLALEDYQPKQTNDLSMLHVLVDRLRCDTDQQTRLAESLQTAYQQGSGLVRVVCWDISNGKASPATDDTEQLFSEKPACVLHGVSLQQPLSPRQFSFNSPHGACTACEGLGNTVQLDWNRWINYPQKPLFKGALGSSVITRWFNNTRSQAQRGARRIARKQGITLSKPAGKLTSQEQRCLLDGDAQLPGLNTLFNQKLSHIGENWARAASEIFHPAPCPACKGSRLMPLARHVQWQGLNITQFCQYTVIQAHQQISQWRLSPTQARIAQQPIQEICSRLKFLQTVGLGYLNLHRQSSTLSGGEAQRIRLASQLGSQLVGVLYVLDEPTIGLHPRDTQRLLITLEQLRDRGNTVCVVEHDLQVIRHADHVIDLGPSAGHYGGKLVAQGTPQQIASQAQSLTGQYLSGTRSIPLPQKLRKTKSFLHLQHSSLHNLKNLNVRIPLHCFLAISGVSGSGKSTLIHHVLSPLIQHHLHPHLSSPPTACGILSGCESIERMLVINQSPIGKTPKSNPATYIGIMDHIRSLMAATPQARALGWKKGRFSFNVAAGRCHVCEGRGFHHIEMHFLADVWTRCNQCKGQRYNRQTLQITFKRYNIAQILELEASQALQLFANQPAIQRGLQTLCDVGLGYIQLGQPANTLSAGEAQRLKLATELSRPKAAHTIYILDEPTTGLHSDDVHKLLQTLHQLVNAGHSVIIIEHNPEVLKTADHIIDLGPEEAENGGKIIATTTPKQLADIPHSYTGQALKPFFNSINS